MCVLVCCFRRALTLDTYQREVLQIVSLSLSLIVAGEPSAKKRHQHICWTGRSVYEYSGGGGALVTL